MTTISETTILDMTTKLFSKIMSGGISDFYFKKNATSYGLLRSHFCFPTFAEALTLQTSASKQFKKVILLDTDCLWTPELQYTDDTLISIVNHKNPHPQEGDFKIHIIILKPIPFDHNDVATLANINTFLKQHMNSDTCVIVNEAWNMPAGIIQHLMNNPDITLKLVFLDSNHKQSEYIGKIANKCGRAISGEIQQNTHTPQNPSQSTTLDSGISIFQNQNLWREHIQATILCTCSIKHNASRGFGYKKITLAIPMHREELLKQTLAFIQLCKHCIITNNIHIIPYSDNEQLLSFVKLRDSDRKLIIASDSPALLAHDEITALLPLHLEYHIISNEHMDINNFALPNKTVTKAYTYTEKS